MSDGTGIEWCDATWNPLRGCSRKSEGCRHCYAEKVAARFSGPGQPYEGLAKIVPRRQYEMINGEPTGNFRTVNEARWTGVVRAVPEHLEDPLGWRRPRRIFVNSMSDLFHEAVEDHLIDWVFAVMLLAPHHTFMVLTKRDERMRKYFEADDLYERILARASALRDKRPELNQIGISNPATSPARWIQLGVSVENQETADERIPNLLATPAAMRYLSVEPMLGPVNLTCIGEWRGEPLSALDEIVGHVNRPRVDGVIAGCESGPGARPCDVDWLRSLRDQCASTGTAFFLKQARRDTVGCVAPSSSPPEIIRAVSPSDRTRFTDVVIDGPRSKRKPGGIIALPYLDGVQHKALPVAVGLKEG